MAVVTSISAPSSQRRVAAPLRRGIGCRGGWAGLSEDEPIPTMKRGRPSSADPPPGGTGEREPSAARSLNSADGAGGPGRTARAAAFLTAAAPLAVQRGEDEARTGQHDAESQEAPGHAPCRPDLHRAATSSVGFWPDVRPGGRVPTLPWSVVLAGVIPMDFSALSHCEDAPCERSPASAAASAVPRIPSDPNLPTTSDSRGRGRGS
jgi:hypothetical protein